MAMSEASQLRHEECGRDDDDDEKERFSNLFHLFAPSLVVQSIMTKNGRENFCQCEHLTKMKTTAIFSKGAHRVAAAIAFQCAITLGSLSQENNAADEKNEGEDGDLASTLSASLHYKSTQATPHTLFIRKQAFNEVPPAISGLPKASVPNASGIKFVYVNSSDEFISLLLALQSSNDFYHLIVVDNCTQGLFSTWDEYRLIAITSLLANIWSLMTERIRASSAVHRNMPRCCYGMLLMPPFQKAYQKDHLSAGGSTNKRQQVPARSSANLVAHLFDTMLNLEQQQQTEGEGEPFSNIYNLHDKEHDLLLEMTFDPENNEISTNFQPK